MNTLSPDDSKNGTQLNNNKWFRENVDLSGDNNTNILVVYVHKLSLRLFKEKYYGEEQNHAESPG